MKIAFVNQPLDGVLPPDQNSIGIWTYQTAQKLAQEPDMDVWVYAKKMRHRPEPATYTENNITYRFLFSLPNKIWDKLGQTLGHLWRNPKRPFYSSPLYYFIFALLVGWDARKQQVDVIHIHNFTNFVPLIRWLNPRAKIALHMHCEWLSQLDKTIMARRVAQVDLVMGSSDFITNLVKARFPAEAHKCVTLVNGVDLAHFAAELSTQHQQASHTPKIVFVGRVSPEKGVHDLIAAMPQIAAAHPDAQLEIIGPVVSVSYDFIVGVSDDPQVAQLAQFYDGTPYIDHLRTRLTPATETQVTFVGALPYDQVLQRYRTADILINPSYSESFGMSLIEAMACERPVVATRVGGMTTVVDDGTTGLLVERGDIDGLAAAINQLLADPAQRQHMGQAGRTRVEKMFTWQAVARTAAGYFRRLMGATRP